MLASNSQPRAVQRFGVYVYVWYTKLSKVGTRSEALHYATLSGTGIEMKIEIE
jgi:hypothetical protein